MDFLSPQCQAQLKYLNNYQLGLSVGYDNIIEPIIWEFNYRPLLRAKDMQQAPYSLGLSFGWQWYQRLYVAADVAWYPFKESTVSAYFGAEYILMDAENIQSADNKQNFDVKPDSYIAPYCAITFKVLKKEPYTYFKLKAGYAILLNNSVVIENYGTPDWYNYIQSLNKSNFIVSLGVVGRL